MPPFVGSCYLLHSLLLCIICSATLALCPLSARIKEQEQACISGKRYSELNVHVPDSYARRHGHPDIATYEPEAQRAVAGVLYDIVLCFVVQPL